MNDLKVKWDRGEALSNTEIDSLFAEIEKCRRKYDELDDMAVKYALEAEQLKKELEGEYEDNGMGPAPF